MGHYDDCYEADARDRAERKRKLNINTMAKMNKALEDMSDAIDMNWDSGTSMRDALENLNKEFIVWQYDNDLIIDDPKIIIDVLKDKK